MGRRAARLRRGQRDRVRGVSVADSRYAKAALILTIHRRREDREVKSRHDWPDAALRSLDESIVRSAIKAPDFLKGVLRPDTPYGLAEHGKT